MHRSNRRSPLNRSNSPSRRSPASCPNLRIAAPFRSFGLALVVCSLLAGSARGFPGTKAYLIDGRSVAGQLVGENAQSLSYETETDQQKFPPTAIRQINFASLSRRASGITPIRRVLLRGGESLHGELYLPDAEQARFSGLGVTEVPLPRSLLAGVFQPAGERCVLYEDFEREASTFPKAQLNGDRHVSSTKSLQLLPDGSAVEHAFPGRIPAGRIELRFYDSGATDASADWLVEAEFAKEDRPVPLPIHLGWTGGAYRCQTPDAGDRSDPAVPRSAGWHHLLVLFSPDRVMASIDNQVLTKTASPGELAALRFRTTLRPAAADSPKEESALRGWIDDVQVFATVAGTPPRNEIRAQDMLRLATGDELFGTISACDPHLVTIVGRFGRRQFPWTDLAGLELAAGNTTGGKAVTGLVARIQLAAIPGAGTASPDSLVAAIQRASVSLLDVEHPYLGRLRLPTSEIELVAPQFRGTLQLIDPDTHHLGDSIREDFQAKLAEGTELARTFSLERVPNGKAFISLLAAELEPRGGAATPGAPARGRKADRSLQTELLLNGRNIDWLNRHVTLRIPAGAPQRLRIPLPGSLLKAGENRLQLKLHPAADDPHEYDDWEFSRLALEIDE